MAILGKFRARCVDAALGRTEGGFPYAALMFEVTQKGDHQGARVRGRFFLHGKNAERTIEGLRLCGWTATRLGSWTGMGKNEVQVDVQQEEGEGGKMYPRVAFINRLPKLELKDEQVLPDGAIDALNAELAALLAPVAPTEPAPASVPPVNGARAPATHDPETGEVYDYEPGAP